jgi:hypothetical protein
LLGLPWTLDPLQKGPSRKQNKKPLLCTVNMIVVVVVRVVCVCSAGGYFY